MHVGLGDDDYNFILIYIVSIVGTTCGAHMIITNILSPLQQKSKVRVLTISEPFV